MIIIYLLIASILGAGATGIYGYSKGYKVCDQQNTIALLEGEVERLKNEKIALEKSNRATQEINEETNKINLENQETINALQSEINRVGQSGIIDSNFLKATDKIK